MTDRIQHGGLQIATELYNLIDQEIAPGTGVDPTHFWGQFEAILDEFGPRNEALLRQRDTLQAKTLRSCPASWPFSVIASLFGLALRAAKALRRILVSCGHWRGP
mgnify:CR=1 FL=1